MLAAALGLLVASVAVWARSVTDRWQPPFPCWGSESLDDLKGYWRMRTQRMAFARREGAGRFTSRTSMVALTSSKSVPASGGR